MKKKKGNIFTVNWWKGVPAPVFVSSSQNCEGFREDPSELNRTPTQHNTS